MLDSCAGACYNSAMKSETIVFNGIKFRRYPEARQLAHRRYYRPGMAVALTGVQALHQEIWKNLHGAIPPGCDIHHKDGNTSNNTPENLICLTEAEHHAWHAAHFQLTDEHRQRLDKIRPLATMWHRSEEGRKWHSEHGKMTWETRIPLSKECAQCHCTYQTISHASSTRFCSDRCMNRHRTESGARKRYAAICKTCATPFIGERTTSAYCSRECVNKRPR